MDSLPATLDLTPLPVELLRPGGLLLIPVLVLLWWLLGRRREARSVGSTALWHQLGEGEAGPSRDGGRLLFLLLLALAASRPCLWWPPPDEGGGLPRARLVREGGGGPPSSTGLAVEGILEAGQGEREITVSARGRRVARVALALDPGRPAAWRAALPALAEGDRIRVTIRADGSPPLSLDLTAPPPPEPPSVEDRSGCRAIADALLALEQGGFIRRVTAEGDASVFRGRGAHELEGGDPSITIPARDAPVAGILPRPRPGMPPRPLLSGLDARRWTILSRREPLLDGIGVETILPSTAGSLLARRGRHVAFAFDPDDSDLPDRPAWPVLLGRILEEIVPRQAPESEPGPRRSPLPAILLIALALAVIPWAARTRRARIALALCLLAALAVPPLRFGGPPRARLEAGRDGIGAGAQAFTEAARRLADGGLVEVPPGTPPPLEESSLLAELRARRVALVPAGTEPAPPTVAAESSMVSEGAIVRLLVSPAFFPGTITAIDPDGREEPLAPPAAAGGRWEHRPGVAGLWSYLLKDTDGKPLAGTAVAVEGRVAVLILEGHEPAGARSLVSGEGFQVAVRTPATAAESPLSLPEPPGRGVIIWNGLEALGPEGPREVEGWLRRGGTLLASAAPPFLTRSASREALEALLPGPLPDPPRRRQEALGIILVDLSGSLRGAGLDTVIRGVRALLEGTPAGGRWGVCGFRSRPGWIAPPGTPVTEKLIEDFLAGAEAGGGTRLDLALELVIGELLHAEAGRTLLLVTDGRAVPADWAQYGRRLRDSGVELEIVGIGGGRGQGTLRTLAVAAGGRLHVVEGPGEAAELLREVAAPLPGPWHDVEGELRGAALDPLLSSIPRRLPAPRRRIDVEVRAGAELLLVDAGGAPLLLSRRHGKGRSLLWASGLDPDSLPPGRAGERLRAALATLLVSAARSEAAPRRRVERRIDSEGRAWLTLERLEGERALLPVVLRLPGEASRPPVEAVAVDPQRYRVAIPASPSAPWRLRIAGDREADQELGGIPGPPRDDAALSRLLRRSKGHAPATAEHPLELLFLLVAALVALRSWGAASPAAPASPRLGSSAAMEG